MKSYKLVILPGDGIGPEVIEQAKIVLDEISSIYDLDFELIERACGFEYKRRTGDAWPEGTFELCRDSAEAILLGAIGRDDSTKPLEMGEKSPGAMILLGLRSQLDLYANVRPVKLFPNIAHEISGNLNPLWQPENIDMVIVRENTEGFYISQDKNIQKKLLEQSTSGILDNNTSSMTNYNSKLEGISTLSGDKVLDLRVISLSGSKRVIEFAFNLAHSRNGAPMDGKQRLTCVDKSNVLNGCRLFRKTFNSVGDKYPDIEKDYAFIDAFTLALLQKPERFDVIVTTNLFGDIITDLAAMLQGGLGMAPSANVGEHHGLFEPVHGSAPTLAGKGIANPVGMILSTQMMLRWLGEKNDDNRILKSSKDLMLAVNNYFNTGKSLPIDLGGNAGTNTVTQKIIEHLKKLHEN